MGVMSVLSFSDIKYAGEQSRGAKAVEDILEDSTMVQVDYPRQKVGECLSACDRKEILLEVEYSRQVPNNDLMDDGHSIDNTSKEVSCAPLSSLNKLLSDGHVTENPSSSVAEEVTHTQDERAGFSITDSSSLEGCNQSSVNEAIYLDRLESYKGLTSQSFSVFEEHKKDFCVGGEQGLCVIENVEPNNCVILTDLERRGINKNKEVGVLCNAGSLLTNTSNTTSEWGPSPSLVHNLPKLAWSPDFEHNDLLEVGEKNKCSSPACISDQIMQDTDCNKNGNGDCESGLPGTKGVAGGQGVYSMESLFESNNSASLAEGKRDGTNNGEQVVIPCNPDSILINTSNAHAESGYSSTVQQMIPGPACSTTFENGDFFAKGKGCKYVPSDFQHSDMPEQGKDIKYLSSGCISNEIMHNRECKQNGNPDSESGLPRAECVTGGQGIHVTQSLFDSNNVALLTEGKQDGMNNDEVVIPCNAGSILLTTSDTPAESGDTPSAHHMLPDPVCRTVSEQVDLLANDNDYRYFSSGCTSDNKMLSTESKLQNHSQDGKFGLHGTECGENDHPVALWVKWRGKWKTGIQCLGADIPLTTLRAKPTHERKKYIAVFFPRLKTYSWVDMLLVSSIDESPEPLAYGTHRKWRKLVKDLTVPRRYIIQKLSLAMLNISDQLHTEAVIENARKAATWKEFALELSHCRDYSEIGMMLLKLHNMMNQRYITHVWLKNSYDSWLEKCQSARSAESIEMLTEELMGAIAWNEVNELWKAPVQPELGPEWKTWKQEAMKYFTSSQSNASCRSIEESGTHKTIGEGSHISRKRAKFEAYQTDNGASQMEASGMRVFSELKGIDNDGKYTNCQNILETMPSSELNLIQNPEVKMPIDGESNKIATGNIHRETDSSSKYQYRQCLAFVETKGRQCGRWANDGDTYCCVHLNNHGQGKPSQEEQMLSMEASMCEGMTIHGRNCKHRAQLGSQFCKKHRLQTSPDSINLLSSSRNKLKRKHFEDKNLESTSSSNFINGKEYGLVTEKMDERNHLMKKSKFCNTLSTHIEGSTSDSPQCIGYHYLKDGEQCLEIAKLHTLYCEQHLPKFLKRARNGKSRIVSKDVFTNLLRSCSSRKQKLYLHQACELLYGFMRSNLSQQKPVSKSDSINWILSEASKDLNVGEYLLKLVSTEREKIISLWGFDAEKGMQTSPMETDVEHMLERQGDCGTDMAVKCKICSEGFLDDKQLGAHWSEFHKKEGSWLFRGYACAVCMNSFTNREVLATHVKESHGEPFLEHSTLFRCMSCSSHFVNSEQLWQHALSTHPMEFRLPSTIQQHNLSTNQSVEPKVEFSSNICTGIQEKEYGSKRFKCRFCGLRFDLLPDLGRHHQAAHMNAMSNTVVPLKRGNKNLKRSRHCLPGYRKNASTFRSKNQSSFGMPKHSNLPEMQTHASETVALGRLLRTHCSDVAGSLFSQFQKTKPRPSNLDILSVARSACCHAYLRTTLEVKFGKLPENLYLKAAKLCSELNIEVNWHLDGFICPKGCNPLVTEHHATPLKHLSDGFMVTPSPKMVSVSDPEWEMDESHHILHPKHFNWELRKKFRILCDDVSFGKESVPVACVLDEDLNDSVDISSGGTSYQELDIPMPWHGFTYVTERLIAPSLDAKNPLLGCACPHPKCYPENCDHVYLFDNDYENAEDIHGKPMRGRFPYAERGRIVLAEGYLVYECNSSCKCDSTCQNRVLQRGVQVKMEIFRTENKGWAIRAGEAISRGTFVCEYVGEVLNEVEASEKGDRYGSTGCNYVYDIDAHVDGTKDWTKQRVPYVIDATKYGNVSRFINHSCSPNLASYQVLVESMDSQLAHIGLYASRDINAGEELAYDYRYKLLPGDGCLCHCGAPNCRGRLY